MPVTDKTTNVWDLVADIPDPALRPWGRGPRGELMATRLFWKRVGRDPTEPWGVQGCIIEDQGSSGGEIESKHVRIMEASRPDEVGQSSRPRTSHVDETRPDTQSGYDPPLDRDS